MEADRCYVLDRWYAEFALWNEIVAAGSSYVCRIRDNSNLSQFVEHRPLSATARQHQVLQDLVVDLGSSRKANARPQHPVRVIRVQTTPHKKTGGRKGGTAGPPSDGILRIATNLLDVPAEVIADIYQHRWTIGLFFRTFKQAFGRRKLRSHSATNAKLELDWSLIALWCVFLWGQRELQRAGHSPAQLSAASAIKAVQTAMRDYRVRPESSDETLHSMLANTCLDQIKGTSSKRSKNYPMKKQRERTSPPKIVNASKQQITAANEVKQDGSEISVRGVGCHPCGNMPYLNDDSVIACPEIWRRKSP